MTGKTRSSGFGNIEKRTTKNTTGYRASFSNPRYGYSDNEPRRISKTFTGKTAASAWLAQQRTDIDRGAWLSPLQEREKHEQEQLAAKRDALTFGDYAQQYLAGATLRPETRRKYENNLAVHILPEWEDTPLKAITTEAISDWITFRLSPQRAGARKKSFELFRAILNHAEERRLITHNPCIRQHAKDVNKVKTSQRHRPIALEPEQVIALAEAVPASMYVMVLFMAATGLRLGEVRAIQWGDIDLKLGRVNVCRAVTGTRADAVVGYPKTDAGFRTLNIDGDTLVQILREHRAQQPVTGTEALVFPPIKAGTKYRSQSAIHSSIQKAGERLGYGKVSPHDLRHTFATLTARIEGITVKDLQRALGHSTPTMAIYYIETSEKQQKKIALGVAAQLFSGYDMATITSLDTRRRANA